MNTVDTILGRAFASLSAEQQGEVIETAGFFASHTYDRDYSIDMQGCRIAEQLRSDGWRLIYSIVKFAPEATQKEYRR